MTNIHEKHLQWFENRTKEERDLAAEIFDYEEKHFQDFTLSKLPAALTDITHKNGKIETLDYGDLNLSLVNHWRFYLKNLSPMVGLCNLKHKTITITKGLEKNHWKSTILHEMIHAYLSVLPIQFKEYFLIEKYKALKKRIPKLDKWIHAHIHHFEYDVARSHELIFLLKSFELDLKLKYPLGTIAGYDRQNWQMK